MRLPSIALRVWNGNEIYLDFIEFESLLDIEWFVLKCAIFLLFNLVIFFADTTRKPRAGEEDGRGKSETNRRWVCWKLHMKRRNCSQWQQEDSSVTNSTTEILLLLTGSLVLWINLGPPDWLVLSLTNQLQPPSLDSLIPRPPPRFNLGAMRYLGGKKPAPKIWEIYHCPLHWSR